ncbi:MAG: phage minor head protein [Acidithiobacillus sp.]|nr:phage minor head protein [Acidithiobacillus sp.]
MNTILQFDPTRTLTLRKAFVADMDKRFNALKRLIRESIIDNDCFGLVSPATPFSALAAATPGQFRFDRSAAKVEGFMAWLQEQEKAGVLELVQKSRIGAPVEQLWANTYIDTAYQRGIRRGREELRKQGVDIPTFGDNGLRDPIIAAFNQPVHADRVGLIYSRVFSDLKGITSAMDTQISRVLAQGIAEGRNPRELARIINDRVDAIGIVRARTLARTEVIRAHHAANVQEYRNAGVEGVSVMVEWSAAGFNVCPICLALQGKRFTLDEIEFEIPKHPNCFIDPQTPVYTSIGWKPIGKIEIGDLVLTHKNRFRKVYGLPRMAKQTPDVVRFVIKGGKKVTMTANHRLLVTREGWQRPRWKMADQCTLEDKIHLLAGECRRCKKPTPYFNEYCSRTCLSLDITDRQWANPAHRKNMSEKASAQLNREYKLGIRDKDKITKAANTITREMVKKGEWVLQREEVRESGRHLTNTLEHREASSLRMKSANPMKNPVTVEKARNSLRDLYFNHPEKRLNYRMARHRKSGRMTSIEKKMSELLDKMELDYVFQYPILNYNADFALPGLGIVIECDGAYWHQDKDRDLVRQKKIEKQGWSVLRYDDCAINNNLLFVEEEIARVAGNHSGEYKTLSWGIESIERWTIKKPRTLFNLSVEEDESYMAKGVVVHNCRCVAIPIVV